MDKMDEALKSSKEYIINHVFLPPRLPQHDDESPDNDLALCGVTLHGIMSFAEHLDCKDWTLIQAMFFNLFKLHRQPDLSLRIKSMTDMLKAQVQAKGVLVFPVRAQNACVIVRTFGTETTFETFRVDPPNDVIMNTVGRVIRSFPDTSITVPNSALSSYFCHELSSFLSQMDCDTLEDAAAFTKKAGGHILEVRETASSHYITRLFMAILAGLKGSHPTEAKAIVKHTRSDVVWSNSYKPWRRSPLWLIMRVSLQSTLHHLGYEPAIYKAFMVFFMASILSLGPSHNVSSELLFCMQSKVANRMRKLSECLPSATLTDFVQSAMTKTKASLQARWKDIQSKDTQQRLSAGGMPSNIDIKASTKLLLPNSRSYLHRRIYAREDSRMSLPFYPKEAPRLFRGTWPINDFIPAKLKQALEKDRSATLFDIESFTIQEFLRPDSFEWPYTSSSLAECMQIYIEHAQNEYRGNPETTSIMILTVFVLWVVLDRLVTAKIPLLCEYSPEIPQHLLQPLMLSHTSHINCYIMIQDHLSRRYSGARSGVPSVFDPYASLNSFSNRYFSTSSHLQNLKNRIENDASLKKSQKRDELATKEARRRSLFSQAANMDHKYNIHGNHKAGKCPKCRLEREAREMKIDVFEWPLPDDRVEAEATVFELDVPSDFKIWRAMTYDLLFVFSRPGLSLSTQTSPPVQRKLLDYGGLAHYTSRHNISNVTIASKTKSFGNSHYRSLEVSLASPNTVCVKNGLSYALYDQNHHRWIKPDTFEDSSFDGCCVWQVDAHGRYAHLSYAVQGVSHAPNRSIANQSIAPADIELHEHASFGVLRSGGNIQWLNIAREIRTKILSFSREEVRSLVLTAALQVGPVSGSQLDWHVILADDSFATSFLHEVEQFLSSISDNWAHNVTLETLIMCLIRLLSSIHSARPNITSKAIVTLRLARDIAYKWMHEIHTQLSNLEQNSKLDATTDLRQRLCAAAALCRLTYNVEPCLLHRVILSSSDVHILVECHIRLYDYTPPGAPPKTLSHLLIRDTRFSLLITGCYLKLMMAHPRGLDKAVKSVWNRYQPSNNGWVLLSGPNDCWATTRTSPTPTGVSMEVHLNLLTGSLLIEGKPLGRLPAAITSHPTYVRLLNQQTLDVVPSTLSGMDYATREAICPAGYHLHFKLVDNDLIVRASLETELLELIPHTVFQSSSTKLQADLPHVFIEEYCHWLKRLPNGTYFVEFRPLSPGAQWMPSEKNWQLKLSPTLGGTLDAILQHGINATEYLVDCHKKAFDSISYPLTALESQLQYIHVIYNSKSRSATAVTVELPRFKLSFSWDGHVLRSKNLRDMVVDENQDAYTLYGLRHRLVLRSLGGPSNEQATCTRSMLIPYGEVGFEQDGDHVKVQVETGKAATVRHFRYEVNPHLHTLVGATLLSELYRIYLHALTSHPLPDPLLGHSGTEEALRSLCSARCKSFMSLADEEQQILLKIAKLSPHRGWYPEHLHVMQTVKWAKIGSLSQHWAYPVLVTSILGFNNQISIFKSASSEESTDLVSKQRCLALRALSHNCHLYSAKEYQLDFSDFEDSRYVPSEIKYDAHGEDSSRASYMSKVIRKWPKETDILPDMWGRLKAGKQPISKSILGFTPSYSKNLLQLEISDLWLPFYIACTGSTNHTRLQSQLIFTLSSMAYQRYDIQLLSTFLAFATMPNLGRLAPPNWDTFNLSLGTSPSSNELSDIINNYQVSLGTVPDGLQIRYGETETSFLTRRLNEHKQKCREESQSLAQRLVTQWNSGPCSDRSHPESQRNRARYINFNSHLEGQIQAKFLNWHRNMHFKNHINDVQNALVRCASKKPSNISAMLRLLPIIPCITTTPRTPPWPSLLSIISQRVYDISDHSKPPMEPSYLTSAERGKLQYHPQLNSLLDYFVTHKDPLHQTYGRSLQQSRESMASENSQQSRVLGHCSYAELANYLRCCVEHHQTILQDIHGVLRPLTDSEMFQDLSFHWPRINTRSLLELLLQAEQLQSRGASSFAGCITLLRSFAISILMVQRAERLISLSETNSNDLVRELLNRPSLDNQSADWIVVQIDGNFLARPIQLQVAQEMIAPSENANTVIQLNMGEGKSSVIVPLVASSLADGQKLARVVVLKPLAKSMFSLLVKRLSGLANRRVFYLPFSRDIRMDEGDSAAKLYNLYESCLQERGVIVAQPEHILSFKLMGIDLARMTEDTQTNHTASHMLSAQRWLTARSRDILDESDEILNVKYQLIYTSGRQRPLENHPYRWLMIQEILESVKEHVMNLNLVDDIEVEHTQPCVFPIIRILNSSSGKTLISQVAEAVVKSERFRLLPTEIRLLALEYITQSSSLQTHSKLRQTLSSDLWQTLLLFRGLFASGILQFVLEEKRWRVSYGLDPRRTLLAVPYRAKDVPALRADFGHPDVAVILSCLSYYYGGLTREQVTLCFQLLMKLDDPAQEYNLWTKNNNNVPHALREFIGVNLDDSAQQERLYPSMERNQAIINFYLSRVVFPREAKQFSKKLCTSAWDLAETRIHPTTGFSGTNDNQDLLPISISQKDPVEQLGTNARVIECLLQTENDHYVVIRRSDAQILSSQDYLDCLLQQTPPIRVLLDVGAQMLDKTSDQIAHMWLENCKSIEAVVFFNEEDQLSVMTRDHSVEFFEQSYYSQKLELCAIYLDDAHTRGTDLKLPNDYRAAVTLGPKLTKDRLVQGCMRMRKLGLGQSVMFFAPSEVDSLVRKLADKGADDQVHVIDVLRWAMNETCLSIRHNVPHWAQQGADYQKRDKAWKEFLTTFGNTPDSLASHESLTALRESWEDDDARTLEDMYGVQADLSASSHPAFKHKKLRSHLHKLGFRALNDVSADEEQEREVSHEAEQEREVERPPPATAAKHQLHPDVKSLVETGRKKPGSPAFVPMFSPLEHLDSLALSLRLDWSHNLWSTKDFASTIVGSPSDATDYQRPVNWLLTTKYSPEMVVALSPYEANLLLPVIRKSKVVHLHMYAPRVNPAIRSFEDLRSFAIPPVPSNWAPPQDMLQVNLWAGQLYFRDLSAYHDTRMILGIVGGDPASDAAKCESDGFVSPRNRKGRMNETCRFVSSPLTFLKEVVALRQKGKGYQSTHIGKIFDRRALQQKDFD